MPSDRFASDCHSGWSAIGCLMTFVFSNSERRFIFDSDLCLTEVGLRLANCTSDKNGNFAVKCSKSEEEEFLRNIAEELAYRGFRPGEDALRALASRLGVTNVI